MPDIALRLHRDMLVLSAPLNASLARQGFDVGRDYELITLLEPDSVHDALRLEAVAGAQCLVTNTASITPAQLAQRSMEGRAKEIAVAALEIVRSLAPQHVLVEMGPCGLPLDAASKASLNESRDQYARAARLFAQERFDAFFLNGFRTCADLKCALMGLRQASDLPIMASVEVAATGALTGANGRDSLEGAFAVMNEYGATVAGLSTEADLVAAVGLARRAAASTNLPLLVQLAVRERNPRQGVATPENPYFCPDVMVEAAVVLRGEGVQFLRATGAATSAYTGALAAAVSGFDVAGQEGELVGAEGQDDRLSMLAAAREQIAAALANSRK